MDNDRFLLNNDLFAQHTLRKIKLPESYDTILNLLTTIQEYREFAHPNSDRWIEYIQDVFHLLGFSARFHNQRLMLISEMGLNRSAKILVGISLPEEDILNIAPWLKWSELLSLVASSMNIQWGIMTNGMELRIYDFLVSNFSEKYYWANIEKIINNSSEESFYSFYKILFYLKQNPQKAPGPETKKAPKNKKSVDQMKIHERKRDSNPENELEPKATRRVFYNIQVGNKEISESEKKTHISVRRVIDIYQKMIHNSTSFDMACDAVAKKYGIEPATVLHDVGARLHINPDQFTALVKCRNEFIFHLKFCFPGEGDNIDDLLEKDN